MLPESFIQSILHTKGFRQKTFLDLHESGKQLTSIRLNPLKPVTGEKKLPVLSSGIPWAENGYYLDQRPSFTFDPYFHAGCYYVQEASSMLLEQAMRQTTDLSKPIRVLDLCAAPGGKSTHLQSLIHPDSLLVSNEVIRSRAMVLRDNLIKWGGTNAIVTNNDPRDFEKLSGFFDLMVVDAPCSGSGLFRREPEAIDEWSLQNVQLCSQRQQRILSDVLPALKEGGILVYSTCSYSEEEDEAICRWLAGTCGLQSLPLTLQPEWAVVESGGGYRCWPDQMKGEGFFLACFQKTQAENSWKGRSQRKVQQVPAASKTLLTSWVNSQDMNFILHETTAYAWPGSLYSDFNTILDQLRVIYSGVRLGELIRDKMVPDHALAMSCILSEVVSRTELDQSDAIIYLQKKDVSSIFERKGWQLVTYGNHPLGWVNVLPNRVNNYYPRELRILKDK